MACWEHFSSAIDILCLSIIILYTPCNILRNTKKFTWGTKTYVCERARVCECLTVGFGGDPQGGRALSWAHVIVSNDSEAVALFWFQV